LPTPVADEVFAAYARAFSYDRTPLTDVVREPPDATAHDWIRETVSFPAPYGRERVTVHLLLPNGGRPPYQPVVFVPGGIAWQVRSSQGAIDTSQAGFLARSGRALVLPILKGTYERNETSVPDTDFHTNVWRDIVVADYKDLSRTIDYLATRSDLALDKIGFIGNSRGGAYGPVFLALEPPFKAAVFWVPGFHRSQPMPEVQPIHFAPRMKQPVLLLSGRYDAIFPEESSQMPFFRALGTPDHLKHRIPYESGHNLPLNDRIRETIAWFDRHLGPIR
jgi:dienelactone hydrolase